MFGQLFFSLLKKPLLTGFVACAAVFSITAHADRNDPNGPEAQLLRIYQLLANGQSEQALNSANRLVEQFPSFHLGHLVRGDILISRTRPLATIGDTVRPSEYNDRLKDLREEAVGRLQALTMPPPANTLPDVLVQLGSEQKHVLVVDASKARLYLFSQQNGQLRYETDYYVSIGKAGSDKVVTGDQKTPLGVYRITSTIPGSKLIDFYGKGALTLDYPNAWDQQRGRTGYGIWLHGVPSNAYSRAPKSSNGCVVLSNPDMAALLEKIQPGTQVVITKHIKWLSQNAWKEEQQRWLRNFSEQALPEIAKNLPKASVYRYPDQKNMIQISFESPTEISSPNKSSKRSQRQRDQYWAFDGQNWRMVQKGGTS